MIDTIDRKLCEVLARDIQSALSPIAAKHGLTVNVRGGKFDGTLFTPRVEFQVGNAGQVRFEQWATASGLNSSDYGKKFRHGRDVYAISDFKPSAARSVGTTRLRDGRVAFWRPIDVRMLLEKAPCP